jgi:surfeit locus 1 family protein
VVLYPTPPEVECLLKRPFVGGLLLLDPEAPGGYVREWTDFGFPPQRHYGYAVQWFALAIAALVVFVVVNRKRPA